jgi:hypothetical protein
MRFIKIIIFIIALLLVLFTPETMAYAKIARFMGIGIIIFFLMQLMSKVPSKKSEDDTKI